MRHGKRIPATIAATACALLVSMFSAHIAFAISISPPTVSAPAVLRGVAQTKSILVGRILGEQGDLNILVSTRGDYASYIIFEPTFIIP
ncbi:MAG: hypothetical protein AAB663_00220, partial [Patescibacteria group bacterium]